MNLCYNVHMATAKEWLNQKFEAWEKAQGGRQSYYAFARYLEVSQSSLGQWLYGSAVPEGDDVASIARKLGPEIYDVLGLPRPNAETQRAPNPFARLPAGIRLDLAHALAEIDTAMRQKRLPTDSPEARQLALEIFAKWGFRYEK